MLIRAGYEMSFSCEYPTHMLALLSIHPSRHKDLATPHRVRTSPDVPVYDYPDNFGNVRSRLTLPAGLATLSCDFTIHDSGLPDPAVARRADAFRSSDCPTMSCCTWRAAAIARPTCWRTWPGRCSAISRMAGSGCRRSSISPTTTSASATNTPAPAAPPGRRTRNASACAGTSAHLADHADAAA